MDWRHDALCRDEDPELFFPIGTTGPAATQVEHAKVVCRRCPAVQPCLEWALETSQEAGVWGATSEDERRALRRSGARAGLPSSHSGASSSHSGASSSHSGASSSHAGAPSS